MFRTKGLLVVCMLALALMACEKKKGEEAPAAAPKAETAPAAQTGQPAPGEQQGFSKAVPKAIAGKKIGGPAGKANAELLNKKKFKDILEVKGSDGFTLEGWAVDDAGKSVPETVVIELYNAKTGAKYYAPASRQTRDRSDVADFFKEPGFKKAGYIAKADIASVPAGEYEVIVVQVIDGKAVRAYPGRKIKKVD